MSWIDDYKGKGPWDFTEQPIKPYYNEGNLISSQLDPIWSSAFEPPGDKITTVHFPWCGYWTKGSVTIGSAVRSGLVYYHDVLANAASIREFSDGKQTRILDLSYADNSYGTSAGIDSTLGRGYWKVQDKIIVEVDLVNMVELRRFTTTDSIKGLAVNSTTGFLYYNTTIGGLARLWKLDLTTGLEVASVTLGGSEVWGVLAPIIVSTKYNKLYGVVYFADSYVTQFDLDSFTFESWISTWPTTTAILLDNNHIFNAGAHNLYKLSIPNLAILVSEVPTLPGGASVYSGIADSEDSFVYFVTYGNPCYILKWPKNGGAITYLSIATDGSYSALQSAVINQAERKLYIGLTCAVLGNTRLIIVDLDTFSVSSTLFKTTSDSHLFCGLYYEF